MPLSEVDKQFLLKMKSMGLGRDEAVNKLKEAKSAMLEETSPTVSMVKDVIENKPVDLTKSPEYEAALRYTGSPEKALAAVQEKSPAQQAVQGLKTAGSDIYQGAKDVYGGIQAPSSEQESGQALEQTYQGFKGIAKGIVGGVSAIPGAVLSAVPGGETIGKVLTPSTYTDFAVEHIGSKFGMSEEEKAALKDDLGTAFNLAGLAVAPKAAEKTKVLTDKYSPKIVEGGKFILNKAFEQSKSLGESVAQKFEQLKSNVAPSAILKRENEIQKVIDKNSPLRKYVAKQESKGFDVKKDIANSDLLVDAVDADGVIRTKQEGGAISQYNDVIKPAEKVVTNIIKKEDKNIPLKDIETKLTNDVMKSGMQGAALTRALNNIKSEMEGYALRANPDGTVPLSLIQEAKIDKYSNINYLSDNGAIDKAIAKSLKEIVEENVKSADIKKLNTEMAKHYANIGFLEKLDGVRVKGGGLGKAFARLAGIGIGASFGPLGAIVGGELSSKIQGKGMAGTFGKKTGQEIQLSPEMKTAMQQGQSNQ